MSGHIKAMAWTAAAVLVALVVYNLTLAKWIK